jgi:hypothetical protein
MRYVARIYIIRSVKSASDRIQVKLDIAHEA